MAIWTLLTKYVFLTMPVVDPGMMLFILAQMVFQAVPPTVVIMTSIKRRSGIERCLLSTVPAVFIFTYAIMDTLLGGSFLGGGFDDVPQLVRFLRHPQLLLEVGVLLVLHPILMLVVKRWMKHAKWWMMALSDLMGWGLYAVCLAGLASILLGSPWMLGSIGEQPILWYTYSIFAVLFQVLLNLTAVVMRILFQEREQQNISWENIYDDRWCQRKIIHILMRGHRFFLVSLLPLITLLVLLLAPTLEEDFSIETVLLILPFFVIWLGMMLRMLFPRLVRGVRVVLSWEDGEKRRRTFCEEFLDPKAPPYHGGDMDLSKHFLLMRTTLNPVLLYLPDVLSIELVGKQYCAMLRNGERVPLASMKEEDLELVQEYLWAVT